MNTQRLKVGVIGVGSLGQWHARIYSELPDVELVGVCDVSADRAAEVAGRYGTRAFANPDELAGQVEAVSLVVPTDRHHEVFGRLMRHRLHVLVEKPIAATTAEAEAMVAQARAAGRVLQVGHVERFNPVMEYLEDNLRTPRFIEATRLAPYPPPRPDGAPRGTEVSVVLDLMIHDLEIILHLVRAPLVDLHAVGVPVLSPSEDLANVRLVFEGGCVANVTASRISPERIRKLRVFQADTYVSLDYMNQSGHLFRKTAAGLDREDVPIEKGEPLARELAAFVRCVREQGQPAVTGSQASEALKLAVRICEQMRSNPS